MQRIIDQIVAEHIEETQAIVEKNRSSWSQVGMLVLPKFQDLCNYPSSDPDAPSELHISPSDLDPIFAAIEHITSSGDGAIAAT